MTHLAEMIIVATVVALLFVSGLIAFKKINRKLDALHDDMYRGVNAVITSIDALDEMPEIPFSDWEDGEIDLVDLRKLP